MIKYLNAYAYENKPNFTLVHENNILSSILIFAKHLLLFLKCWGSVFLFFNLIQGLAFYDKLGADVGTKHPKSQLWPHLLMNRFFGMEAHFY